MIKKEILIRMPKLNNREGDISKKWYIYFYVRNPATKEMERFMVQESLNRAGTLTERKKEAKKLLSKYRRKLRNGWTPFNDKGVVYGSLVNYSDKGKPYKIQEKKQDFSIEQYLSEALTNHKVNLREKSFQTYQSKLRVFVKWLKDNDFEELGINEFEFKHAQSFLNNLTNQKTKQPAHITTRHSYRNDLKGLFNKLIRQRVIEENPFENTQLPPKAHTNAKRAFNRGEQKIIKEYCQKHDKELWLFIEYMFYTAVRPAELRQLKVNAIDIYKKKVFVNADISKNKKGQYVTIPNNFIERVKEHIKDRPSEHYLFGGKRGNRRSKRWFYDKMRKVLDVLGFGKDVSLYSWKHTLAEELYYKTKDIKSLQEQLRHHSLDQVDNYLHSRGLIDNDTLLNNYPEL